MTRKYDEEKLNNTANGRHCSRKMRLSVVGKKLKSTRGFSLTELLVALILCLMTFALANTAITTAGRQLKTHTMQAEAKMLCSTLTMAVEDELRYVKSIESYSGSYELVGDIVYSNLSSRAGNSAKAGFMNEKSKLGSSTVTRIVVYNTNPSSSSGGSGDDNDEAADSNTYRLVPDNNYTQGTSAALTLKWNDTDKTADDYHKFTGSVTVTDSNGKTLAQQTFAVRPVNVSD